MMALVSEAFAMTLGPSVMSAAGDVVFWLWRLRYGFVVNYQCADSKIL